MTTQQAIDILWDLGYSVSRKEGGGFVVARTPQAVHYNLPRGCALAPQELKTFVYDAVCKAGCTALPKF